MPNIFFFAYSTVKNGAAHKTRGAAAAPRRRLVVNKTEFSWKMCATTTFYYSYLFYALVHSPEPPLPPTYRTPLHVHRYHSDMVY